MKLSAKIQFLRKEKQLSQEQLGDVLGVTRQAISKWESGQSIPDVDNIIIMSKYFNVSTDYLLKEEIDEKQFECHNEQVKKKSFPVKICGIACLGITFLLYLLFYVMAEQQGRNLYDFLYRDNNGTWIFHYIAMLCGITGVILLMLPVLSKKILVINSIFSIFLLICFISICFIYQCMIDHIRIYNINFHIPTIIAFFLIFTIESSIIYLYIKNRKL